MKQVFTKLFLVLFALVMSVSLTMAQTVIFSEDFENTEDLAIPTDWSLIDADGDGNNWYALVGHVGILGYNGSAGLMTSASYSGSALTPDNWLITPQIGLGTASSLKYYVCAQDAAWPADHYGVYVSTTGTDVANFILLFEETLTASREQGVWFERDIDLSAYNNQPIYIAWRHFNSVDVFRMNLDDITVTSTSGGSGIAEILPNINAKVHPNPVISDLKIECEKNIDKLELYDAFGRIVISQENVLNNTSIDVSSLANGIYILKLRTAEGVGEYKVVKN